MFYTLYNKEKKKEIDHLLQQYLQSGNRVEKWAAENGIYGGHRRFEHCQDGGKV